MSIQRYRNDNPRTAEEIATAIEAELQNINPSSPVVRGTQNYAFIQSMAATLASKQEQSLNQLYDAAYITDASENELTKRARSIGVIRQDALPATGVVKYTSDSPVTTTRTVPSGSRVSTGGNDAVTFETTETATLTGPTTKDDTTEYTETGTSYVTKTSFTVNVDYRETIDVSGDIKTSNTATAVELRVENATDNVAIDTFSSTSGTYATQGPTTYDVSSMSGDKTIEFQLRIASSGPTAYLDNAQVDLGGETGDKANIECTETGPIGNVGAGTVTFFIDEPTGIDNVTNPNPTGDTTYTLTDGTTPLQNGADRESDEELRDRALDSGAIGGAGTAQATELALENIDEVISADIFSNRSDGTVDDVDPWHTEVRVYGGEKTDIAQRLYEVLPLGTLKTLQGGANGTLETVTLTVSDLYGDLTIEITRPSEISLYIEIDVVHTSAFGGTPAAKDAIVEYIGGTTTDARSLTGLGQGENVLVNEIENVVEDVDGVDYANVTLLDKDGDNTDDTTTDSDGVPILSIGESEVPAVDAANITTTETLH